MINREYIEEKLVSLPLRNKGGRTYNYRKPGDSKPLGGYEPVNRGVIEQDLTESRISQNSTVYR
jgi:hypothetical protein